MSNDLGHFLFNCCTDEAAPDWTQYDAIEVSCCVTRCAQCNAVQSRDEQSAVCGTCGAWGEAFTEARQDPTTPGAFWTVYGRFAPSSKFGGTVEAITDVSTLDEAEIIATLFRGVLKQNEQRAMVARLDDFAEKTEAEGYTDTGEAWELLNAARALLGGRRA